jgi:hypothetical protein
MNLQERFNWLGLTILGVVILILISANARVGSADAVQDVSSLDRRISLLEQRFYSLESSMNRLQQFVSSQRSTAPASDSRDREIAQMTLEIQRLQLRLADLQCGLLQLDERTKTRRSGEPKSTDPCRANPDAPLRFPSRP